MKEEITPNHFIQRTLTSALWAAVSAADANVMHMNENNHLPIVIRVLGALGGFLGGGIIGTILIILVIAVTDSTFGLNNIWPGALSGAIVGAILGICLPKIGKTLAGIMNYFP